MYFTPSGFTKALYDDTISRLDASWCRGAAGRLDHVALETDGQIQVFDIWDSQEAFGATLVPIMTELGDDPGAPQVATVHNVIEG